MKRYLSILFLIIFIVPSVALASWWNPFSWFNNWTFQKIEEIQVVGSKESSNIPEITQTQTKPITKTATETTTTKKKEEVKIVVPTTTTPSIISTQTTTPPIITAPVITTPPVQNTAPVELIKLDISNITSNPTADSVNVSWETNISSESKVLFNGNAYFSENGVSKFHSIEINNLEASHSYNGTITALANNIWGNEEFTFTTKPTPPASLNVTLKRQNCSDSSCIIEWQTNYQTTSTITITRAGNIQVFDSENGTDVNHVKNLINLIPNTQYFFKINTIYNNEQKEINGNFQTLPDCGGYVCA